MFNLAKIMAEMTLTSWVIAAICLLLWVIIVHYAGMATEKRWGDRESGALAGFFVPGFVFIALLYWM